MERRELLREIDHLKDYFDEEQLGASDFLKNLDEHTLICECAFMSAGDFKKLLQNDVLPNLSQLQRRWGAGAGCGKCLSEWSHLYKLCKKSGDTE